MTQSTQDSTYSWSGVGQEIDIKEKKRQLSEDEEDEEPWWESFKSQSTQKLTQKLSQTFQLSQPSSSQTQVEDSQSQNENASNKEEQEDGEKISFYLKLGKHKQFKLMWFFILEARKMNDVNTNRVNNYLYLYNIEKRTKKILKKLPK